MGAVELIVAGKMVMKVFGGSQRSQVAMVTIVAHDSKIGQIWPRGFSWGF